MNEPDDLIGLSFAADLARVTQREVIRWIEDARMQEYQRGRRRMVSKAELLAVADREKRHEPRKPPPRPAPPPEPEPPPVRSQQGELPADLITPHRAARIAKCHQATVYRWIFAGKLRAWRRAGARYLISESEVRALIQPVVVEESEFRTPAEQARATEEALRRLRERGYKV